MNDPSRRFIREGFVFLIKQASSADSWDRSRFDVTYASNYGGVTANESPQAASVPPPDIWMVTSVAGKF
ncbi:MAG: hypothetical protein JO331_03080 [Verrucomicrobia bacterium]|nr:hypothetical protein [Verrucomicrobiota bacterium]